MNPTQPALSQPALSQRVQHYLSDFAQQPGVTDAHLGSLRSAITSAPSLVNQLNTAAQQGDLLAFGVLPAGTNASGEYDPDNLRIDLPLSMLDRSQAADTTMTLAHEAQHALNRQEAETAQQKFEAETLAAARPGGSGDYTGAITGLIQATRRDEAGAELAGWNALVEHVRGKNPRATLRHIAQEIPGYNDSFVERHGTYGQYQARSNLHFRPDLKLDPTEQNIEAMGQNYFDQPDSGLGQAGRGSYANLYGAWAIGVSAQVQRDFQPPLPGVPEQPMQLNLRQAGLELRELHGCGIDLGQDHRPMPFLDTSRFPPQPGSFRHTMVAHTHPRMPGRPATLTTSQPQVDPVRTAAGFGDPTAAGLASLSYARPATQATRPRLGRSSTADPVNRPSAARPDQSSGPAR